MLGSFDTIILAGGVGSRLQPVVSNRPKCLAEINGRPFLSFLLQRLAQAGISHAILSTGYLADQIETTFGASNHHVALRYSRESQPLGTGGGVRHALELCHHPHLLVINGDSFLDFDWREFFSWFDASTMRAALVATWQENAARYGRVEIDPQGKLLAFREKHPAVESGWINAGIYLIERSLLENMPPQVSFSLERDFFPKLIGSGFYARGFRRRFIDIGTPDSYLAASDFFASEVRA